MRKLTLLLAVLALAATPSVADAAKKKAKKAAAAPAAATQPMPGEPGAKVIAGYFREVGKIGQPPAPAPKGKKK